MAKENIKKEENKENKALELLDILKVIISGNQQLDDKTFKKMILAVGENYNKLNETSAKVSMSERRKRMQDNFYGAMIQMMLQISQVVVAQNEELEHLRVLVEDLCDNAKVPYEKRLTEQDKLAIKQQKYIEMLIKTKEQNIKKVEE